MTNPRLTSILAILALAISGCGGGSGGSSQPPPPAPDLASKAEAFQLLNQATFGATEAEAQRVMALGVEAWVDDQLQRPASLQLPHMRNLSPREDAGQLQQDRVDIWFRNVLHGGDQLRQRVEFALS